MPERKPQRGGIEFSQMSLEVNRQVFARNGDALVVAIADFIRAEHIVISPNALDFLIAAVSSVR